MSAELDTPHLMVVTGLALDKARREFVAVQEQRAGVLAYKVAHHRLTQAERLHGWACDVVRWT